MRVVNNEFGKFEFKLVIMAIKKRRRIEVLRFKVYYVINRKVEI